MTAADDGPSETAPVLSAYQQVRVGSGFGYGVIGADLHVFADRGPVYLLRQYRPEPKPDTAWLLAQPSRMLNARYAIVGFTGRDREQAELAGWRDASGPRLSARWLHAPGGQGKTRLASAFARQSANATWKVITVTHGPGSILPPSDSQDLRLRKAAGVLLVVDYADRWPASHLSWLFSNALLHQHVPARLLLIARTAHAWPAVRAELGTHQADTSDQQLAPLPEDPGVRQRMYTVACDTFASHYGIADPTAIPPPGPLDQPDFGLTLAVHIAALVAVDAAANGSRPPKDMAGLSAYLLDRERQHWARLHENRSEGLEFGTPPSVMARAVFTAALTGAVSHRNGTAILTRLGMGAHAQQTLADHGICYPSADPANATALEPLYPDRLAEDFLALALPGHDVSSHLPDPWTTSTPATLLTPTTPATPPAYIPRAVTFMAAAAARWPHTGAGHLYPLLRHDPVLAVQAGSAALAALAELPTIPVDLLEAIASRFPEGRHTDLDSGMAAVSRRLADCRLATTQDPRIKARIRHDLAIRLSHAGFHQEALDTARDALADWRHLAQADSAAYEPELAAAVGNLAGYLRLAGRRQEALAAAGESVEIFRRVALADRARYEPNLAAALLALGICSEEVGRLDQAVASVLQEATGIYRRLAKTSPQAYEHDLAVALNNLGTYSRNARRREEAVALLMEAVDVNRRLTATNPAAYEHELARALSNLGNVLTEVGQPDEGLRAAEEAVRISRRLTAANPAAHEHGLATVLKVLGDCLRLVHRLDEALAASKESAEICRRLAAANPAAYEPNLAATLDSLSIRLADLSQGRSEEAVALAEESAEIYRRLIAANSSRYEPDFARVLNNLGARLAGVDRCDEALIAAEEGIAIRRQLATSNPAFFEPNLAWELGSLGVIVAEAGRPDEAMALLEESVAIFRRLSAGNPAVHAPELAAMLTMLAGESTNVPARLKRAREEISEAIKIYEPLAERRPEVFRPALDQANEIRRMLGEQGEKQRQQQEPEDSGQQADVPTRSAEGRSGADIETEAKLPFRQAALGATVQLRLGGVSRSINVRLPASVHDGQKIRLRGHGSPRADGGPAGDLYVTIRVQPHEVFGRDGQNLTVTVPLAISEASNGTTIQVPVLDGRPITIRIPKDTPDRRTFRIPSRGLRRADGTTGDLLVSVELTRDNADTEGMRVALIAKAAKT